MIFGKITILGDIMSRLFLDKKRDLFYKSLGLRKLSFATSDDVKQNKFRKSTN